MNWIINPINNKKYLLNSKFGKKILKKYIRFYNFVLGGAKHQPRDMTLHDFVIMASGDSGASGASGDSGASEASGVSQYPNFETFVSHNDMLEILYMRLLELLEKGEIEDDIFKTITPKKLMIAILTSGPTLDDLKTKLSELK